MARELGTFHAERGEYSIDFHVLNDGGEYASAEPTLAVFETGIAQEAVSLAPCSCLIFRSDRHYQRNVTPDSVRTQDLA